MKNNYKKKSVVKESLTTEKEDEKLRFRILNSTPLYDYREACKVTKGIDLKESREYAFETGDETAFWIRQIVANHSTIRSVRFRLVDTRPKSVVMQVIRATKGHPQPEVQSGRPDWTGKERSADPYEDRLFMQDHTAESFVEMAKQRLCMKTEQRTRLFVQEMVETLKNSPEPFLRAVGYCCHSYCWWYGGCPELRCCNGLVRGVASKIIDEMKSG